MTNLRKTITPTSSDVSDDGTDGTYGYRIVAAHPDDDSEINYGTIRERDADNRRPLDRDRRIRM
jgi:hypothetical protein